MLSNGSCPMRHGISIRYTRRLLRSCGVMAQAGVWCSREAAEVWLMVKQEVRAALPDAP